MIKIAVDTHTHSVASGHAYSTIKDNAFAAKAAGLEGFVSTDHGPAMTGTTHPYFFGNMGILPQTIGGVRFFKGAELNILSVKGDIDLTPEYVRKLDFVLAGLHDMCFAKQGSAVHTAAIIAALDNPLVDTISHPHNISYPCDFEAIIAAALRNKKVLEFNSSYCRFSLEGKQHGELFARLCMQAGCSICVASDAHYESYIGYFVEAFEILERINFPEELIINANMERFTNYVAERKLARPRVNN